MQAMFQLCVDLKYIDLTNFNTSKIIRGKYVKTLGLHYYFLYLCIVNRRNSECHQASMNDRVVTEKGGSQSEKKRAKYLRDT